MNVKFSKSRLISKFWADKFNEIIVGGETLQVTLIKGILGHVSQINTQRSSIYFAQSRNHQKNKDHVFQAKIIVNHTSLYTPDAALIV